MPTKTKPKSNVRTSNQQLTQFKFRWWMALILVAVIAIIGIVILRFSHASGGDGGWCDQQSGKLFCAFAVDHLSTRDPNKVQSSVPLVQSPDAETGFGSYYAWYLDSAGYGPGTLIWGGPNKPYTNLTNTTIKGCWWLRDTSGNAQVNAVIKADGNIIAQTNLVTGGAGYNPYCVSQKIAQSGFGNVTFELRLLSGSVRANRFLLTKNSGSETSTWGMNNTAGTQFKNQ